MKRDDLSAMSIAELVSQFTTLALAQDKAELMNDNAKFRRLFWQMDAVEKELKARTGDQRSALLPLLNHSNAQVRLRSAIATLAIASELARRTLELISDRQEYPQAIDARGMIRALRDGSFRPT
jgi:recombinational DNA repair ATPase RecF